MDRSGAGARRASAEVVSMASAINPAEQILNDVTEHLLLVFGNRATMSARAADVSCPTSGITHLAAFYFDVRSVTVAK
jgi:hypothetical protein